ncbi:hypothetical protein [Fibrobacter sp. UWH1]|uniref:hypothetical protein n=1 Tax=Fibrobacter sp. UWH1 TaxID=1964354 RepID=UPI0015960164|nr:hypothetical protein [Fibrobacter sp. UWH1]
MKKITRYITAMLMAAGSAVAANMPAPENPATGIWIQQVGDIVPHPSSKATLYYTKYQNDGVGDRVKGISYQYNGAGYLLMKPSDKKVVCSYNDGVHGADGIVQHPDGDLLVAGQEQKTIYKVSKTAGNGNNCVVKSGTPAQETSGIWHLMMDPTQKILWGSGIPGPLFRFSTETDVTEKNFSSKGYHVELRPNASNRRKDKNLATIVWDGDGTAFFTYSDYMGGGCEPNHENCTADKIKERRGGAYFGYFTDTTYVTVTEGNIGTYGGKVGEKVIKSFGTKILIDSLEGAHGATYDEYSKTIFVFGGSKIVQIQPYRENGALKAKVVATIDMREYFFEETLENLTLPRTKDGAYTGWRLDQGTVDGYGHLFVASNTGHMVFVDYVGNSQKLIKDNILIHVQWIDNFLDDLAPLKGVIVDRAGGTSGADEDLSEETYQSSSALITYNGSSSSLGGSSSSKGGSSTSGKSSNSNGSSNSNSSSGSNGGNGSSGSNGNGSSGSNGGNGSSGSNGNGSSGSNGGNGSSGSNGDNGSSGSNGGNGSSGSNGGNGSSGSNGGNGSSGSNGGNGSSGSNGGNGDNGSSGSNGGNSGSNSSSSRSIGAGEDVDGKSSSSRVYYGADDYIQNEGSDYESYPSADDFDKGDSAVASVIVLNPTTPGTKNSVVINGNSYLLNDKPKGDSLNLEYNSGKNTAKVGQVLAITLDSSKVKEYFGDVDSLEIISESVIALIDKENGGTKTQTIKVNSDGSVTFYVTSDKVVSGGAIKVRGGGEMIIIDNITFYDPIPDARVGYIKDTDGNNTLDYMEILLNDSLSGNYDLDSVKIVLGKDTIKCANPKLNDSKDRILVDVSKVKGLPAVGEFPKDAKALIYYGDGKGATYGRESSIVEVGSFVIKDAYAIRNANGMDSLFLQFSIDLIPADVGSPEMLIMLKQEAERYGFDVGQIKKVYMPTKDIVILVAKTFDLKGGKKDSVSLYPNVTFSSLPYITSDEYDREIPVTVTDRFASAKNSEYWDTDGDGVLDQIVTVFDKKLTAADLESVYMSFPWYSSRGLLIQLQAQPGELRIDPKDSTRVIWDVHAATPLASGVTSIREDLPEATIYTYYSVFNETFVNEETVPPVDKMSPVVSQAFLSYGSKADTLIVTFSEPILTKNLKGEDFFSYIHGGKTIELDPMRMEWSSDGYSVKLILDGGVSTIMPGDSLIVRKGAKDAIKDNYGNVAGDDPQPVIIGGLLNHLVEATNMGTFDANDDRVVDEDGDKSYTLQTVSSVNLRYVPGSTTKEDLQKEGALGQLVQLGERFVPQLLDRAQVGVDGSYDPSVLDSLKPEDVYISFIVNFFDHLGQYVNDTIITVPCNSPKFGGNCLETDKKVFVNWNFKDHNGRFVGTGVYNVQFKMVVRYENKKIEEEIKDKWGVRRKKSKKK